MASVAVIVLALLIGFALHYGLDRVAFGAGASRDAPMTAQEKDAPSSAGRESGKQPSQPATTGTGSDDDVDTVDSAGQPQPTEKPAPHVVQTEDQGAQRHGDSSDVADDADKSDSPTYSKPLQFPEQGASITQMLRLWGVFGAPVDVSCPAMKIGDLRCVIIHGTVPDLVRFNRPALLEFAFDRGTRNVLLVGLDKHHATLVFGDGTRRVPRSRLKEFWTGEARLIWRQPIDVRIVRPGSVGGGVVWVRRQLAQLHGVNLKHTAGKPSPIYDDALGKKIRTFQRKHNLLVDGVVGPRTIIALNGVDPAAGTPVLIESKGD